jgi:F-type H+-transporting ATPase subunit b
MGGLKAFGGLILLTSLFLVVEPGLPASGAEHSASGPGWGLLFSAVNFLIFAYVLRRFLKEPIRSFLTERRGSIVQALGEARASFDKGETILRETRRRLDGVDQEIASLKSIFESEAEHERKKQIARAEETAAKIRRDSAAIAGQEERAARQRLQAELAELAVGEAIRALPGALKPEVRRRISEEFISEIGSKR